MRWFAALVLISVVSACAKKNQPTPAPVVKNESDIAWVHDKLVIVKLYGPVVTQIADNLISGHYRSSNSKSSEDGRLACESGEVLIAIDPNDGSVLSKFY